MTLSWNPPYDAPWELDSLHFPVPLTPTHAHNLTVAMPLGFRDNTRRLGLLLDYLDFQLVNGFCYYTPRIVGAPKGANGPPPRWLFKLMSALHPKIRARLKTCDRVFDDKPWLADVQRFEREIKPEALAAHLELQAIDPARLTDAELAAHLGVLQENAFERYRQHHLFSATILVPVGDFLVQTMEWTGLGAADCLRAVDGAGGGNLVAGVERELSRMVSALKADAKMRAAIESAQPASEVLASLRSASGEVGEATRAWLDFVGLRLVTGYDISDLYALEMPEVLIRTLRAALSGAAGNTGDEAREAAARLRDAVPAAQRARYDALLGEARAIAPLRDQRALFLDLWAYGILRRAVLEAGRRVTAKGRIGVPEHLLDASHDEMVALLAGTGGPAAEVLAARTRHRTTVTHDVAPIHLGPPAAGPPPIEWLRPASARMMRAMDAGLKGILEEAQARAQESAAAQAAVCVTGLGASAGVYVGPARVVRGPEDFGRLQQGDVLVTRCTTEAFNVVLPLLGAVVTDRGGLLCHAATVAREYGIPAVVGSKDATRRIGDGLRVRVDGSAGQAQVL
jgi:pyruvate,water dikinase